MGAAAGRSNSVGVSLKLASDECSAVSRRSNDTVANAAEIKHTAHRGASPLLARTPPLHLYFEGRPADPREGPPIVLHIRVKRAATDRGPPSHSYCAVGCAHTRATPRRCSFYAPLHTTVTVSCTPGPACCTLPWLSRSASPRHHPCRSGVQRLPPQCRHRFTRSCCCAHSRRVSPLSTWPAT